MWELRDLKFGGRSLRYVGHVRGVVRCLDPFARSSVSFSTELRFENWLLSWGDPDVQQIDCDPPSIACLEAGKLIKLKPHLRVTRRPRGTQPELQLVLAVRDGRHETRIERAERVAHANGMTLSVRTRDDIRRNRVLLSNLAYLRQCAAIHADEPLHEVEMEILRLVRRVQALTRAWLIVHFEVHSLSESQIDAVLARLRWQRHIWMYLADRPLDGELVIQVRDAVR